jgi:hypothetical protein
MERIELEQLADVHVGSSSDEVGELSSESAPLFGLPELLGTDRQRRFVVLKDGRSGLTRVRAGDLVVALAGPSAGRSALVGQDHVNDVLGHECARIRITGDSVSAAWIQIWTRTSDYRGQIERALTGSAFPRLSRKSLREMWVPVPAMDQQDQLVLIAKGIDAALSEARQTADDLQRLQSKQLDFGLYKLLKEPS